jgi:hypothetical protein
MRRLPPPALVVCGAWQLAKATQKGTMKSLQATSMKLRSGANILAHFSFTHSNADHVVCPAPNMTVFICTIHHISERASPAPLSSHTHDTSKRARVACSSGCLSSQRRLSSMSHDDTMSELSAMVLNNMVQTPGQGAQIPGGPSTAKPAGTSEPALAASRKRNKLVGASALRA